MMKLVWFAVLVAVVAADVSHLSQGNKRALPTRPSSLRRLPVAPQRALPVAPKRALPVASRPLPVAPKRVLPVAPRQQIATPKRVLPVAPRQQIATPKRVLPVAPRPVAPVSSRTQQGVGILRSDSSINPDGSYQYAYETENGITAEQQGQLKQIGSESGNSVQGSYQYNSPEGVPVVVQYIADENGYQPSSDILPTPPPVPAAILRALAWIAAHPQQETKKGLKRF